MKNIRVVFMGTPDFSVPVLEGLIEEYEVVAVVTQPDKKVGRKQQLTPPPIKKIAQEHKIPVLQPVKIRQDYQEILSYHPDIIITCAYGQIIPKAILDSPTYGCINVHASLLPKLRGGAPIHKAIIYGYEETGITIMYMNEKMDEGDIISQESTLITEEDNLETLQDRLSILGKKLLLKTLPKIIEGSITRKKQVQEEATYAYNISHEEEKIDFTKSAREVFNQIRGLSPLPGAYTTLEDKLLKVYKAKVNEQSPDASPGQVSAIYKDGIGVACAKGEIILQEIKLEGKKKMTVKDYLNGVDKNKLLKLRMK